MFVSPASTPAHKKNSYSQRHRITRESEIELIKQAGKRLRTEHLEARAAVSLFSYCRVAVVVAKYGHTIVQRNRLRRRVRELVRICLIPSCVGVDLIIRALPSAYAAGFQQLGDEVNEIKVQLLEITTEY